MELSTGEVHPAWKRTDSFTDRDLPRNSVTPMEEKHRFVSLAATGRFTLTELCVDFGGTPDRCPFSPKRNGAQTGSRLQAGPSPAGAQAAHWRPTPSGMVDGEGLEPPTPSV